MKRVYSINNIELPSVSEINDLGVTLSDDFKFSKHCCLVATKGFQRVNLIFRVFHTRDLNFLLQMYKTFVRPKLEYASDVWSPYILQDIDVIEKCQRLFTRRLPGMQGLTYSERLDRLSLQSLEVRRIISQLVMVYKIIHGLVDIPFDNLFKFTPYDCNRGHKYKLYLERPRLDIRKHFFCLKIVHVWNDLPNEAVNQTSAKSFKNFISKLDFSSCISGRALVASQLAQPVPARSYF